MSCATNSKSEEENHGHFVSLFFLLINLRQCLVQRTPNRRRRITGRTAARRSANVSCNGLQIAPQNTFRKSFMERSAAVARRRRRRRITGRAAARRRRRRKPYSTFNRTLQNSIVPTTLSLSLLFCVCVCVSLSLRVSVLALDRSTPRTPNRRRRITSTSCLCSCS
jgi:hypothetical protein